MKVTSFFLEPDGGLRLEDESVAVAAWRAGGGPLWIDLDGGSRDAMTAWLADLGLDLGMFELPVIGDDAAKIVPLANSVFFAYPMAAGDDPRTPTYFGVLCLDRLVITMHEQPTVPSAWTDAVTPLKLREGTTTAVVCALVLLHATRMRHRVVRLRGEGGLLADKMDSTPGAVSLEEILALKRGVLGLGGVVDEELALLEVLRTIDKPVLRLGHLAEPLQTAIEITRATDRDIDRLDRRMSDLQYQYDSARQDEGNRRLGRLTILSAIFMPLTLLAGIYGMNFDAMPELHWRFGYPVVLVGMALIAIGLLRYSRSRGWLE